ncbi:MAG: patatin-like phospholipase family protein, partial [Firmicutes bacterium]|nr:patatin-like phospholipase family protein [Bacillota bacterium]
PTPLGFVKGNKLYRLLCRLSNKQHFYETYFPLFITATNLCNGQLVCFCPRQFAQQLGPQRPEVIFTADATLAQAVRASTAIPGIFEPLVWQGHLLVDGGLKNNVPADLLRWAGADIIIAVDLGFHSQNSDEIDTILEILIQSLDIMGQTNTEIRLEQTADVVLQPVTGSASLTDIEKVPGIIEAGGKAALEAWPQIALLVQNFAKRRAKVQPYSS